MSEAYSIARTEMVQEQEQPPQARQEEDVPILFLHDVERQTRKSSQLRLASDRDPEIENDLGAHRRHAPLARGEIGVSFHRRGGAARRDRRACRGRS